MSSVEKFIGESQLKSTPTKKFTFIIDDEKVTTAKIADNAITEEKISGEDTPKGAAVTTSKIKDGAVTNPKIANGAVTTIKIQDFDAESSFPTGITNEKLADESVTESKLASRAVTEGKIAPNAVTAGKIANDAVIAGNIANGAITHDNLTEGCVQAGNIANGAVENGNLAPNAVQEGNIAPGAIHTEDIHDGAVTTAKIEDYNPNSATPTGVTTAKIADYNVTEAKLADGAVTMAKLADDTISKMETITDATPTEGSVKPIQSGGVQVALMDRAIVGDIVGDPAQAWEPGTAEAYIDQKIAEQNAVLNAKMSRQDAVIHALNGQDIVLVSALPQTGEANKIYRLTGADSYTDYMWDASLATPAFTAIATYSFPGIDEEPTANSQKLVKSGGIYSELALGAVYDISAHHNNTSYTDLAAALGTNGNNIPQGLRKGGMSVKFVQSSDNNYVQARCMAQNFTTDVTQWQGVDNVPTAGSGNLVKSGGVAGIDVSKTNINVHKNLYNYRDSETGFYIHADGHIVSNQPNFFISGYIKVKPSTSYYLSRGTNGSIGTAATYMAEYDASFTKIGTTPTNGKTITTTSNTVYLRISGFADYKNTAMLTEGSDFVSFEDYSPINYPIFIDQIKDADFSNILKTVNFYKEFTGADTTLKEEVVKLREGRIYKVFFNNPEWSCTNVGTGAKFYIRKYLNGTYTSIYNYVKADTVPDIIRLHADENDYYEIGVRADSGTTVIVNIVDVTESSLIKLDRNLKIGNAWVYNGTIEYNDTSLERVSTLKYQYIPLHKGDTIRLSSYDKYKLSVMYNNNGTWNVVSYQSGLVAYTVANDGQYVICVIERNGLNASIDEVNDILSIDTFNPDTWNDYRNMAINNNLSNIDKLKPMITNRLLFSGANGIAITKTLNTIVGHTYRLYFLNRNWSWENIGSGNYLYLNDSSSQSVFAYTKAYYPKGFQYRDFIATDTTYTLGIRADSGTTIEVLFADITDSFDGSIVAYNGGYAKMKALYSTLYRPSYGSNSPSRFNLVFFSDIHAGTENCRRIAEFRDTFGFSDVLHGGDDVQDKFTDTNTVANNGGQSFLNIVGNHDVLKTDGIATGLEYYNKFIAPNVDQWGNVVFPENADVEGYCYYYKDYSASKVRLVALDCMHWDATQKTWFEGVLADAATNNLSVIAASHYCPDRFPIFIKDCTFCTLWRDDVNAGLNSEAATAVANSIANNGLDFICWLFGHTHRDYFVKVHNHPEQYAIGVDRGYGGLAGDDSSREAGTRYYDSFDIISVDTKSKHLTVVKIGVNSDRLMRQKNYLVFDYANHVIIHNS